MVISFPLDSKLFARVEEYARLYNYTDLGAFSALLEYALDEYDEQKISEKTIHTKTRYRDDFECNNSHHELTVLLSYAYKAYREAVNHSEQLAALQFILNVVDRMLEAGCDHE